jgi:hypothetical protein
MELWTYRDSSLRGLDLIGFDVEALDGILGTVERAASDAAGGYLVVDAGALAPRGGRVLLPAGVIDTVDLDSERIFVRLTRDKIRSGPEYDWQIPFGEREREQFAAYYGATRAAPTAGRPVSALRPMQAVAALRREPRLGFLSERTKQELYDEAKKLDIPGRSKMSKAELARALEKHGGARPADRSAAEAKPIDVQKFLEGVGYPTGRAELVREAKNQRATAEVRKTLERLPEKRFKTPTEVSEAIGEL